MARLERPTNESSNPATKFLEWKSNDKCFQYYDKQAQQNVKVELPLKVLFLEHYHTVKGWHDSSESGIYANEVYSIGKEPLTVKAFKGGEIAEGLYKDIKDKVKNAGARYTRSIYVMLEDGTIGNIQLKGAAVGGIKKEKAVSKEDVKGYSDFYKDNSHLLDNQWIEINEAKEGKSGSVKYSIPFFELGETISREMDTKANYAASELQTYMNAYFNKEAVVDQEKELETSDDLDF